MDLNIRTHHLDITTSLKDYAEAKLSKLTKFFENITSINVELDIAANSDEADRQIASATIAVPNHVIRAKDHSEDMYASIDGIYDKLMVQLKKHHDKIKSRRKHSDKMSQASPKRNGKAKINKGDQLKLFIPKPMAPEDAAIMIESNNLPFIVFRNIETESINVLYPDPNSRTDYKLIET